MDVTAKAIALRSTDFKENDKFITLYSLEYGKISVHARGVRKGSAKLKFAADQFCFGQYELAESGGRYTLKTCQQLESFYSVREDVFRYYAACVVAECLLNFTEEGQADPQIFVETLRALQSLCCGADPLLVTLRFLLGFLELDGFKLDFGVCSSCGKRSVGAMYLDLYKGGVVCENCRTAESATVAPKIISMCGMVSGIAYDKLVNLNFSTDMLKEALALCSKYISHSFFPLKSLGDLLKLAE